jgi:hypothetical protein
VRLQSSRSALLRVFGTHTGARAKICRGYWLLGPAVLLLAVGCASTRPPHVYEPSPQPGTQVVYADGTPIAWVSTDCCLIAASVQPASVGGNLYIRAYVLYENRSAEQMLFEPRSALGLGASQDGKAFPMQAPCPPTKVLARIENEKNAALLFGALVGAVNMATVPPTTITGPGNQRWRVDDSWQKRQEVADRTAGQMEAVESNANAMQGGVGWGLLRRNTVFPGGAVGGFVYFPVPFAPDRTGIREKDLAGYAYRLAVATPCDTVHVDFIAAEGE